MGNCLVCQKPNATLECGICKGNVCKKCAQFLEDGQFTFMPKIPDDLKYTTYCGPCYDEKVAPALSEYEHALEKAKGIVIFYKADSKESRNFKRTEKPFKVANCPDKDEALMRLAFLAVQGGFNSLLDVEIHSEKIRSGTYQTTKYSGVGIPATITSKRFL